jgi:hypothetical protein
MYASTLSLFEQRVPACRVPFLSSPVLGLQVVELSRLFREPAGIMFWVVVLSALMGLQRTQQLSSRLVQCLRSLICSIGCTFPLVRAQS